MIYAQGIVSFLSKNIVSTTSTTYLKNARVHIEIIEITERHSAAGGPQIFEVTCRYTASLYEDYACRSLEDYNGKVKPFLQRQLDCLVLRVEIHYLRYV